MFSTLHDEVALRQLVSDLTQAWNRHDGIAYGQPFRDDAHFRVVWGQKASGRAEIIQSHQWLFANHYAHSHLQSTIETIRLLHPDVAYIEVTFRLKQAAMADGSPLPFEKTIAGMTAVKAQGQWCLATFNNAGILAAQGVASASIA